MKTKLKINLVIPSETEQKKIDKTLSEIKEEEKSGKPWDYRKVTKANGKPVKLKVKAKKKKRVA